MKKQKRNFIQKIHRYHKYYQRSGLYPFLLKNLATLFLILAAFVAIIFIVDWFVDLRELQKTLQSQVNELNPIWVYLFFYLTESILGMIPPDIFIIWGKYADYPYLVVTLLATISYLGGITAYKLGKRIRHFPRIDNYIRSRHKDNFHLIKKWGGVVIIMAALFPLPFATISLIAGMVNYPFRSFLYYGLTRYLRFFLYAIPIYSALNSI